MSSIVDQVLGEGGLLATKVPHYEPRTAQVTMARAVDDALRQDRPLVVEAGTGTGKTLAYLVPALASNLRVIVSTATKTLQDQLLYKDVPLLQPLLERALGRSLKVASVKGLGNYLCLRRLREHVDRMSATPVDAHPTLASIVEWSGRTETGDRVELPLADSDAPVWNEVSSGAETRLGSACPYYERCFVTRARREAADAKLVLVNHHLFFADLALRQRWPGAQVLPVYDAAVFDEAHQLEDVATDFFGVSVSSARLYVLTRDLHREAQPLGGRAKDRELAELTHALQRSGEHFFGAVRSRLVDLLPPQPSAVPTTGPSTAPPAGSNPGHRSAARQLTIAGAEPATGPREAPQPPRATDTLRLALSADFFSPALVGVWHHFDAAAESVELHTSRDLGPEGLPLGRSEERQGLSRRARALRDDLALLVEGASRPRLAPGEDDSGYPGDDPSPPTSAPPLQELDDSGEPVVRRKDADRRTPLPRYVHWGELRQRTVTLHASPVEVAPLLREHLLGRTSTAVFTSATLTTAESFTYFRSSIGLGPDVARELRLDSPFDYGRQALLYLPRDLPEPQSPLFAAAVAKRCLELVARSRGRAFLLFTSYRNLREVESVLRPQVRYPVLVQGEAPNATLLDRFRAEGDAVLLATSSFWEGVDVPGPALSLVVLDKLPFATPDDPLVSARLRALEERGVDGFRGYQIPRAALALRQGFGRLIRSRGDRGVVAMLDRRLTDKGYGRTLLRSLPPACRRTHQLDDVAAFYAATDGGLAPWEQTR
jgi:ATP-dependent DNA helicase DinG